MAVAVDHDLDLDVAVVVEPLLEVQRVVAERGPRLGPADLDRGFELARRADHAHALAAAAGRRLEQHRVADALRLVEGVLVVAQHPVRAGDRRQAEAAEEPPRGLLRGEPLEDLRRGPDERELVGADRIGEAGVLGQEAVPGVDRVAAGDDGRGDDGRSRQVAAPRLGRPDADRLVGELHGQALAVRLAVGDDRRQAHRPAGAQDPQRDLAAVGDQDARDHQGSIPAPRPRSGPAAPAAPPVPSPSAPERPPPISSIRTSCWPYSTPSPAWTSVAAITPSPGATTSCGTPSRSTAPSRSPARTRTPGRISGRGWNTPTAGEVAATRYGSGPVQPPPDRTSRCRAVRVATGLRLVAAVDAISRVRTVSLVRSVTSVPGVARLADPRPVGREMAVTPRHRRPGAGSGGWPAQADPPAVLPNLDLAEAGRCETADQLGQEIVRQAPHGRVVLAAFGGVARYPGARGGIGLTAAGDRLARHRRLDLVPGRGLVAAASGRPAQAVATGFQRRPDQVAKAIRQPGPFRRSQR